MSITFNADEIFEMAQAIERNAARFYRKAAKRAADRDTKKMFEDMAAMEDGHERIFASMRAGLDEKEKAPTVFDPDNQAALYLQTMAAGRGSEGRINPTTELSGSESIEQILEIALDAEKNSVVFYTGLKELVPQKSGRDKVEAVIGEELVHIATINQKLMQLR